MESREKGNRVKEKVMWAGEREEGSQRGAEGGRRLRGEEEVGDEVS